MKLMNCDNVSRLLVIVVLLLAGMMLFGCQVAPATEDEEIEDRVAVMVEPVVRRTVTRGIHLSGQLQAESEVTVVAEVTGTVKRMLVQVGDWVEAGEVLMELSSEYLQTQRDAARAQLRVAKVAMDEARQAVSIAQREYDRMEPLHREGVISRQQWDQVQDSLSRARHALNQQLPAQIQQAQTALSALEKQMGELTVTAPIAAEVALLHTSEGNTVGAGSPMVVLMNRRSVKVQGLFSERQVVQVEPGDKVSVRIPSLGEEYWHGLIEYIAPSPPQGMSGYPFSILLDNPDGQLRPGMTVDVMIPVEERLDALVVPLDAVLERANESLVFVVDSTGRAQSRTVRTGLSDGQYRVIESGLTEGEYVVIVGAEYLETGTLVQAEGLNDS